VTSLRKGGIPARAGPASCLAYVDEKLDVDRAEIISGLLAQTSIGAAVHWL
jgi:hypothetical protein